MTAIEIADEAETVARAIARGRRPSEIWRKVTAGYLASLARRARDQARKELGNG